MVEQEDDLPTLGAKALLKAAHYAAQYSTNLLEDNPEDEEPIQYWAHHADLLRQLADEWSALDDGWKDGRIIPWRGPYKVKALPPDRPRG